MKRHGGVPIVQDPDDAEFPSMPANAVAHVKIDHTISVKEMAQTINRVATLGGWETDLMIQSDLQNGMEAIIDQDRQRSVASSYTCPDCNGPLAKIEDGSPTRFRCRVGHAYGLNSLHDAQANYVENTLWSSIRRIPAGLSASPI